MRESSLTLPLFKAITLKLSLLTHRLGRRRQGPRQGRGTPSFLSCGVWASVSNRLQLSHNKGEIDTQDGSSARSLEIDDDASQQPGSPVRPLQIPRLPGDDSKLVRGEKMKHLRVNLKICEGCGALWLRAATVESVYCRGCLTRLADFPAPDPKKHWPKRCRTRSRERTCGGEQ
jgi:hypothetical protein